MVSRTMRVAAAPLFAKLNPHPPERYTDWADLLRDSTAWKEAREKSKNGPKVLIANCAGLDNQVTAIDSMLAVALVLRGADVHILMCDEALSACWNAHSREISPSRFVKEGPSQDLCSHCFLPGYKSFRALGLPIHRYGDLVSAQQRDEIRAISATVPLGEIPEFRYDGMRVGEHALAGALRYYKRGDLVGESEGEPILRRYFEAALHVTFGVRRLFSTVSFDSVCSLHGIYVPEGLIGEVARKHDVGVVCWCEAYRKQTFVFSHDDTYHHTMLSEPLAMWENMPWTPEMETQILEYLKSRWYGTHDWIGYTQDWSENLESVAAELGIDFNKPCIGLLTNVIWDAQVHYGGNAFANMLEWTLETIKYFSKRPDLQLIVRVHPAEIRGVHRSCQSMVDEIKRAFPVLPKNIFIVAPDSRMNTYAAMLRCNAAIIYGTKVGVELSSFGIPIVVAGEAWIRNKGLTLDASSAQEYFEILDQLPLPERMSDAAVQRARKYAYHYFFRRLIPLPFLRMLKGSNFVLDINDVEDLEPGKYPGLDVICNGILKREEFIYPAELYPDYIATSGKFTIDYTGTLASAKRKPLVSVIIPTAANHSDDLAVAVDSVYLQENQGELFDLEVIVVGNGSSDLTSLKARHYDRIRYIRLNKGSNRSVLRNAGLRAATGQYVTFLDEGDVWLPSRLRSHIAVLETHKGIDAVYGQCLETDSDKDKEVLWPDAGAAPAGSVLQAFLKQELVSPTVLTVRRKSFEKAGYFDEKLQGIEHYELVLRLASVARFAFVSGPAARVRSTTSTWSDVIDRRLYQTELPYALNKAFTGLPEPLEKSELKKSVMTRWFRVISHRLDKPETFQLLKSHMFDVLRQNPWMINDPGSRKWMLAYASKVLAQTLQDRSNSIGPDLRWFCEEIRNCSVDFGKRDLATRHFIGDTLTRTATQLWDERNVKAAAYTAAYAAYQDVTQVVYQAKGASNRFGRAVVSFMNVGFAFVWILNEFIDELMG